MMLLFAPWLMLLGMPEKFKGVFDHIDIPTINDIARIETTFVPVLNNFLPEIIMSTRMNGLLRLQETITVSSEEANKKIVSLYHLANQVGELAEMEYDFLYDKSKHLLSIGL